MSRWRVSLLLVGLWGLTAAIGHAEPTTLEEFLTPDAPDIDITSFASRAERHFEQADILLTALAAHPQNPDSAIAELLQQYRQELMRGRMELARARAVHQPVTPVLVAMERFTAEHVKALQALLPQLSAPSQSTVRHTLYLVAQMHQSAQAGLISDKRVDRTASAVHARRAP